MANDTLYWSGVQVDVETVASRDAAQPVTGITKANPAVVSYSGADPANGAWVLMRASGMSEADFLVARVANVNAGANTLELEGVDSTDFGTFSSGSMAVLAVNIGMSTVTDVSASGGDANFRNRRTIHVLRGTNVPTEINPVTLNLTSDWIPGDPALAALRKATRRLSPLACVFTFADGTKMAAAAYAAASLAPGGSAGDAVTTPLTLSLAGDLAFYPAP
jgi:hypothetical protein